MNKAVVTSATQNRILLRPLLATRPPLLLWALALLVAGLMALPLVYLVVRAVESDANGLRLLLRPGTLQILWNTVALAVAVTCAATAIALPMAWLTLRCDLPGRRVFAVLAPLPLAIPSYVGAYLFASALGPRGLLQQFLGEWFGVARIPSIYGFWGALLVLTVLTYPYILLSIRATLLRLDPALEEVSRSLGDGAWRTFARVSLPLLRPAIGAGGLLVALYVLRDFGAVSLMRYTTFTSAIYTQVRSFDRSQAALYALVLVLLTAIFLVFEMRFQRSAAYMQGTQGAARPPALVRLGWWRLPALLFCATVIGVSLVLPTGTLLYWLVRGMAAGETLPAYGLILWQSVYASTLAAMATIAAALPVVFLVVRFPSLFATVIERVVWLAYALPGIVIALSLVFFGVNQAPWLYQTLPMLILAYMVLFTPQAVGALRAALMQIPPSIEEAARSLGRGPLRVFNTITLPLLSPALLAGGAMVFLTAMKELPATLLLAPLGFKTLAMAVWSAVSEAYFAAAAAPALLIILCSSLPTALLMRRSTSERSATRRETSPNRTHLQVEQYSG